MFRDGFSHFGHALGLRQHYPDNPPKYLISLKTDSRMVKITF